MPVPPDSAQTDPLAWTRQADADLAAAEALLAAGDDVLLPNACYMAQHRIDKSIKALLVARAIQPPKTHDLGRLLNLVNASGGSPPDWDRAALDDTTQYAIESRYPGDVEPVSQSETEAVVRPARAVWGRV